MDGIALSTAIRKLPKSMMLPVIILAPVGRAMSFARNHSLSAGSLPDQANQARACCTMLCCAIVSGAAPAAQKKPTVAQAGSETLGTPAVCVCCCAMTMSINQKVASRLLGQMGYQPDVAVNGLEALAALEKKKYDIIFMDVQMPEMDGLEATRIIRERQHEKSKISKLQRAASLLWP